MFKHAFRCYSKQPPKHRRYWCHPLFRKYEVLKPLIIDKGDTYCFLSLIIIWLIDMNIPLPILFIRDY